MSDTFQIGDEVEWTSQAGGVSKTKRGRVVAVVPAGVQMCDAKVNFGEYKAVRVSNYYSRRTAARYLIAVEGKHRLIWPRLYWPRTKQLRKVTEEKESA